MLRPPPRGLLVVDGDGIAEPGEFRGTAEAGRTGSQDGDGTAVGGRRRGEQVEAPVAGVVGGEPLQAADLDRLLFEIEHYAGSLAEHLRGADAAAAGPQHVGLEDGAGGAGDVVGRDLA